jgi:acetamidase/formamidase
MKFLDGMDSNNWKYSWRNWEKPLLTVDLNEEINISVPDSSSLQITERWDTETLKQIDNKKVDALVGPIKVNGIKKGDFLKIEIIDLKPGKFGWSAILNNFGLLKNRFPEKLVLWDIYDKYAVARDNFLRGLKIPLEPMLGIIGTSPFSGDFPVIPPQIFGGNLDNRYIKKGSSVHLPANNDGAYFAISDPHASQGNGEVCGTGIETSAEVTIRVSRSKFNSKYPIIESHSYINNEVIVFTGIDEDLYKAAQKALESFIDYCKLYDMTGEEAYILASVLGNLEISEIVDEPNMEVSLVFPNNIFNHS